MITTNIEIINRREEGSTMVTITGTARAAVECTSRPLTPIAIPTTLPAPRIRLAHNTRSLVGVGAYRVMGGAWSLRDVSGMDTHASGIAIDRAKGGKDATNGKFSTRLGLISWSPPD